MRWSLYIEVRDLPPVLRALFDDQHTGITPHVNMSVYSVPRGQPVPARIEQTLGASPVRVGDYQRHRNLDVAKSAVGWPGAESNNTSYASTQFTASPVFFAKGGPESSYWFGVSQRSGRHSTSLPFESREQLDEALDFWLRELAAHGDFGELQPAEREEEEAQRLREEREMGSRMRAGIQREEEDWLRCNPEARAELEALRKKYSGLAGLGATPASEVMILMETVEPNGARETVGEYSLESMIAENAGDEHLVEKLIDLRVGHSFEVGGGAAPRIRLTRLPDAPGYVGNALQGDVR